MSNDLRTAIDILSLLTAITALVVTFLYNRKFYRVATRPRIQVQLGINCQTGGHPDLPKTTFAIRLTNLSSGVSAANISVSIYAIRGINKAMFQSLFRGRATPFQRVLLKTWKPIPVLEPLAEWTGGAPPVDERIERHLASGLPDLVQLVEDHDVRQFSHIPAPVTFIRFHYELPEDLTIPLQVITTFDSGVGAGRIQASNRFRLAPIYDKDNPRKVVLWHLYRHAQQQWFQPLVNLSKSWELVQ
jgi:hypothetical protein